MYDVSLMWSMITILLKETGALICVGGCLTLVTILDRQKTPYHPHQGTLLYHKDFALLRTLICFVCACGGGGVGEGAKILLKRLNCFYSQVKHQRPTKLQPLLEWVSLKSLICPFHHANGRSHHPIIAPQLSGVKQMQFVWGHTVFKSGLTAPPPMYITTNHHLVYNHSIYAPSWTPLH